ncbi:hypothetical protein [Capsulimonas corticalis]|uniref:hypothetical protein n=1 Tax=Capsulimonas corticalis TaxID=2219043 RepID=UPI000F6552F7|nr:hypothetical protein [Capsulimonas corticalis]
MSLSLNAAVLLFSLFGGFAIRAVDPWFQFRFIETDDDGPDTHGIDSRRVGISADRLEYDFFQGRHAGAGCTFYRGNVAVAYLGGRHPVYFSFLDVNGDGRQDILCQSDDGKSSGVWALDTHGTPRDYLREGRHNPSHGALRRLPETSRSRIIFALAGYLSYGVLIVPAAIIVLLLQLIFWDSFLRSRRGRSNHWRGRRWRPLGVFSER